LVNGDLAGVIIVYFYVAIMLIFTEKVLRKYPSASRKILHIMVGNIAFLLPIFETKEVMAFLAAGPFIFFTFLMSPHTPIKSIRGSTSAAGHSMGLVYYSITWTILAYVFFDNMIIIAIGILAMSYGDGFASLIGVKYGKKRYNLFGDEKSYIGSASMLFFTFVTMIIASIFYNITFTYQYFIFLFIIALIAAIVEGITPRGLDNISVPFIISFLYWFFIIS
jgi:dolichol kinase